MLCVHFSSFFFFALLRIPAGLFVSMNAIVFFFSLGHFLDCSTLCMRQICFIDSTVCQTQFNSADDPDIARPFGKDIAKVVLGGRI